MHRVAIAVIIIQVELVTMVNFLSFSLSSCVQIFGGGRARRPLSLFSLIFVHQHLPKANEGTWFTLVVIISIFT